MSISISKISMFKREFTLYLMFTICALYSCIIVINIYLNFAKYIQSKRTPHPMNDILNSVVSVFGIINFTAIFYNIRVNYKHRNFRIKSSPENPIIVYFMCLPLLIVSLVAIFYIFIYDVLYIECKRPPEAIVAATFMGVFLSLIVLLLDTNGIIDTGESWILNFSNFATISLSLITMTGICGYNVLLPSVFTFISVMKMFGTFDFDSCTMNFFPNGSSQALIHQTLEKLLPYNQCFIAILTLTFLPYFIIPWKRHFRALQNVLNFTDQEGNLMSHEHSTVSRIASSDIIFNIVLIAVLLVGNLVFLFLQGDNMKPLMEIVRCVHLGLMLILVMFILADISFWTDTIKSQSRDLFSHVILWIGTVGELVISLALIFGMWSGIYKQYSLNYAVFVAIRVLGQIIQCMMQTILASFALRRRLLRPMDCRVRKIAGNFNPFLALAILNGLLVGSYIIMDTNPQVERDEFWKFLFNDGVKAISIPTTILYRVFCILLFYNMA